MNLNINKRYTPENCHRYPKKMASKMYLLSSLAIFGYLCYISACKKVKEKIITRQFGTNEPGRKPGLTSTILDVFFLGPYFMVYMVY